MEPDHYIHSHGLPTLNDPATLTALMRKALAPARVVPKITCKICGRSYKWRQSYERHIKQKCRTGPQGDPTNAVSVPLSLSRMQ